MRTLAFHQVDVFGDSSLKGNALAVVVDADELSDTTMASFAKWTNLSETTADRARRRLSRAHLHDCGRAVPCRPSDARKLSGVVGQQW